MYLATKNYDGHVLKSEQTKHLSSALLTEFDAERDRVGVDSFVRNIVLQQHIDLIRQLALDVYGNPKALAEAFNNIANELEENLKTV